MSVLQFYKSHRPLRASWAFLRERLHAPNRTAKLSWANRLSDYQKLQYRPSLLPLHHDLNAIIEDQKTNWPHYDYGEGYFYQSCPEVGLSGLRDTAARIAAFDLPRRLAGKCVLDIGCNSGFLAVGVASHAAHVTGMDANPYLIRMAARVASHLGRINTIFLPAAFEDAALQPRYDTVMSFANHSTFDGLTRHTLADYFARCAGLLPSGGEFLFESHAPAYEGEGILPVIAMIADHFEISSQAVLRYGTYLDTGRTFLVARKR